MRLPRDLGDDELARLLEAYSYTITGQAGSHIRLASSLKGREHHITIPKHKPLKIGTLNSILKDVAAYLEIDRDTLIKELLRAS